MGKEVAKTTETENLPDYLKNVDMSNQQDNFDASDVIVPQLKLLQGTSQQCTDFDEANPGTFWHTGMDISLGDEVDFTIISRKKKYLLQAPMDDGQGILARAEDAKTWDKLGSWEVKIDRKTTAVWEITDLDVEKSGLINWGTYDPEDENSPPAATLFYEYLVLLNDQPELGPCVISLARSQIKQAKKGLNTKIDFHRSAGRPMQAIVFRGKVIGDSSDSGDFFNWQFAGNGFASKEVFDMATEFASTLTEYKVQDEGVVDEAKSDDGEGDY